MRTVTDIRPEAAGQNEQYRSAGQDDPFGFFARRRRDGGVVWDASMNGWLALEYAACAEVLRDELRFRRPDKELAGGRGLRGDARSLAVLDGEEHKRLHDALMKLIDRKAMEKHRSTVVRPLTHHLIDRFAGGHAELAAEFSDQLPIRVGAALLGLDAYDDGLVRQLIEIQEARHKWKESMGDHPEDTNAALRGTARLRDVFMPLVNQRKERPRDDLTSRLWRMGPEIYEDWSDADMYAACITYFAGGETAFLIRNLIHELLIDPDLQARVAADREDLIPRLVEEVLRVIGVAHWQLRIATRDQEVSGQQIREGDRVYAVMAAAGRDPARYPRPEAVDLASATRKGHLAFGLGPRFCIGTWLARGEAYEAVDGLLTRLQDLRSDETKPRPDFVGFHVRGYAPLHAVFTERS